MSARPLVVTLLCCAGCQIERGVEKSSGNDGLNIDPMEAPEVYAGADFKRDYLAAECDWLARCPATGGTVFPDLETCARALDANFGVDLNASQAFLDPLLYRIDATQAASCIATFATLDCNAAPPKLSETPLCAEAVIGRLSAGECCDRRDGCAPGLVCERSGDGPGYCSAAGSPGEPCSVQSCLAPASCEQFGASGDAQCVVSLALGPGETCRGSFDCGVDLACQRGSGADDRERCSPRGDVGILCTQGEPCRDGLHCVGPPGGPLRCSTALAADGEGCVLGAGDCAAGSDCQVVADSPTCVRLRTLGEPCSDDPGERCVADLACVRGTCGSVPVPRAIGDACLPEGPRCPDALGLATCALRGDSYVCAGPLGEGEACGDTAGPICNAFAGLVCDPASSKCAKAPTLGAACPLQLCQPIFSSVCVDGTCIARKEEGEPCTPGNIESSGAFDVLGSECQVGLVCRTQDGGTACRTVAPTLVAGGCR